MKPRIVILGGAGAMGRITARDLARRSRGVRVVVADRIPLADRVPGVEAVAVDVADPRSLGRALRGAFAVIASLPYRLNLVAMRGALAAGAHYVDLGGLFHVTRQQLALRRAFERRGLMAILGMGSAPGILNVMAVRGAHGMESVREVHCLVGAVDHTRFRAPPPLGFGYAPDTLLDEFAMPSAVFRDGAFAMVPPLDPAERIEIRFPPPVGTIQVDTTLHSEVATLPLHFADRGIREVTFRQGFDPSFLARLEFLVTLGLAGTEPVPLPAVAGGGPRTGRRGRGRRDLAMNGAAVVPRQVLLALLRRLPPAVPIGRQDRYEV
ncbi:MAG: saccharopine dehydrogenase family protein, partial [Candidatus Eiseniibacteriota bacterium]